MKKYAVIAVMVVVAAGLVNSVPRNTAHLFTEDQCSDCHALAPVKGKRETLRMTAPIERLCAKCHTNREKLISHPVELVPERATLPADMPLSWEGKMTCSTCHDIHASPPPGSLQWSFLRRQTVGRSMCIACHAGGAESAMAMNHSQVIGTAHMKYEQQAKGARVDYVSMACLSCHDGSLNTADDVRIGTWKHGSAISRFDPQGSHPIGVKYMRAMRKRGGLHPAERLDPAVKLVDGRVSCRSCHDLYSKQPKLLVMSNVGSRLCLACHDK